MEGKSLAMKTMNKTAWIGLALALAAVGGTRAVAKPRTEVVFDHPQTYADIKDYYNPTDKGEESILRRLRTFLVKDTEALLPEGCTLTITFSDIDLAGGFEPWRGVKWQEVRIYSENYPPTFTFSFSVTDASGRVLRQGNETLRDGSYLQHEPTDTLDTLRYDKDVLDAWARRALGGLAKA
jgi:hypothetical protein